LFAFGFWAEGTNTGRTVTLTSDDSGKIWQITSQTRWRANSRVAVEIATTAFGASGALMLNSYLAAFQTAASGVNNSTGNALAAIEVSQLSIDLRFAEPRDYPPGEPFGLRLGQQRVPIAVERLGEAWFRLTFDAPLDSAQQYYVMAGPGVEIPIRLPSESKSEPNLATSAPTAKQEENGLIRVRLSGKVHKFHVDRETLGLEDENGQPLPHRATLSSDARTILIEPYRSAGRYRVILDGERLSVTK